MENHYFIACALSDQAKEALHNVRQSYLNEDWFKKIPHQADLHVTLSFLGAVSEEQLNIVSEALDKRIEACSAFPLTFSHIDTFGPDASPRVWWAGSEDSDELTTLYRQVQDAVRLIDKGENRPFRPHATLAKKWKGEPGFVYKGPINPINDTVQEVTIYEINPGDSPMYTVYQSFKLKESGENNGTAD
ncbi:RNA 2',3'-cyclic phosphodiesterase [Jeotgalibacillus malaysiensis]|uniref:RNA 2',3'-cyclic phosphodiesterase n=1 Tax=Jeotgalibacillus malaysiensis TaxID=1508404 RepID=UPI00384BECCD